MINIDKKIEGDLIIISLDGEVDASSSIHLDKAIQQSVENGYKKILVDCTELSYISSAGLGVFMSYLEDFQSKSIQFGLFGLSEKVMNVFEILGLDQLINISKNLEEAKSSI